MSSLESILQDNGAYSSSKAQAHLTLLRLFCALYDCLGTQHPLAAHFSRTAFTPQQSETQLNWFLVVAEWRYALYLRLLVSLKDNTPKDRWPLPPWDVALFLHTHLLSPVQFAKDMEAPVYKGLGGVLDLPLLRFQDQFHRMNKIGAGPAGLEWHAKYPTTPHNLVMIGSETFPPAMVPYPNYMPATFMRKFKRGKWFHMNLIAAVKRQIPFARKITALYPVDPVPEALLLDSQQRYGKFMNLIRIGAVVAPVPALDVDLFWHTHQLSSSNYAPWCMRHVGREINHDDNVDNGELVSGLNETKEAWRNLYGEDYLNPSPGLTFQNARSVPREPSTATKTPPPNLTPAQRVLWDFDVRHQVEHEQMDYRLRQLHDLHAHSLEQAVKEQSAAAAAAATASSSSGGFMKRLLRAAVAENSPRQSVERIRDDADRSIRRQHVHHDTCREGWGRQRWPLLVAARAWGDPSVTNGAYPRQPQGSETVDFPMYAATWYDRRPLGYYDYVLGGRNGDGAIYGGGAGVGGGMCAGKFDGGNCVAPRPSLYIADNSGGGGG